jgi:ESF2/ABP1 family protein
MKPNKARSIFEEYGEITRLFLQEEDINIRKKRKARGGNSSKQFTEGWIEYADKKIAKNVAESLNGTQVGKSKGDFYHDDFWNIKYLKNFKWDYLTEKFAYERRVREQKLKAAMLQSKRTNAEFVELVEKQKAQSHYDERKRKRGDNGDNDNNESKKIRRKFHQNKIIANQHGENERQAVDSRFLKSVWA